MKITTYAHVYNAMYSSIYVRRALSYAIRVGGRASKRLAVPPVAALSWKFMPFQAIVNGIRVGGNCLGIRSYGHIQFKRTKYGFPACVLNFPTVMLFMS